MWSIKKKNLMVDIIIVVLVSFAYYLLIGIYFFMPSAIDKNEIFIIVMSMFYFVWLSIYLSFMNINYKRSEV